MSDDNRKDLLPLLSSLSTSSHNSSTNDSRIHVTTYQKNCGIFFVEIWTILILITLRYIIQRRNDLQIFQKLGIPGPVPNILCGNLLYFLNTPMYKKLWEWESVYGKVFGIFEGPTPTLVISDRQLLQEIFVRKFPKFNAKKIFPLQYDPVNHVEIHMFLASGKRSRRFRHVMRGVFCQEQMSRVYDLLRKNCKHLTARLYKRLNKTSSSFNIYEDTQRLTCDFICQWSLGLDINSLQDDDNNFFRELHRFFKNMVYFKKVPVIGAMLFPGLNDVFRWVLIKMVQYRLTEDPMGVLIEKITEILDIYEKASPEERERFSESVLSKLKQQEVELSKESNPSEMTHGILRIEIIQQLLLMIMAGFETSSTIMALTCYQLSRHPHVQQELREAILQHVTNVQEASMEELNNIPFLSWVVQETCRLYPTASPVLTRRCLQTVKIGDLTIPQGMNITPNSWAMHYDATVWGPEDPHEFIPQRFHPDKMSSRPNLHQIFTFGIGPRSCIGRHIGLIETKLAIAAIVTNFRLLPTDHKLQMREAASITPEEVMVRLEPCNTN